MPPLLAGPYSLRAARRATAAALFFQWFIVLTGATVRLTGSGLGCPNWPTCTTTSVVPELSFHPMVEFLNRVTATPTLLTGLAAMWICWRLAGPRRTDLRITTTLVVLGIFVQAVVGAFTVILELPPQIVSVHFLLSILLLAIATFSWHAAGSQQQVRLARGATLRLGGAATMLVLLLGVIVAGVLTTASGPHSGASGTGQHVERFGFFDVAVTLHARGAYAFLALVVALSWLRLRRAVAIRDLGLLAGLVVVQVTLGEVQYRTGLPWHVVLAHVATAATIWVVAVRIAADASFPLRPAAVGSDPCLTPQRQSRSASASLT
jgi:heme a synthase